jgi:iron complex outermembrane receptor protein
MKNIFHFRILVYILSWPFLISQGWAQYQGYIINDEKKPLEGVVVFEENHATGTVSDEKGYFLLAFPHDHDMSLVISYTGYETQKKWVRYNSRLMAPDTIILSQDTIWLQKVDVSDSQSDGGFNKKLRQDYFTENYKGSFASTLESLPGLSAINVGVGISKPVIRGMSSNRIIVSRNGIRMEGQQWGSDHGLEVDSYDVSQVEIVKGPHALVYGSDALGGLIRILPSPVPVKNRLSGDISSVFKSNNSHAGLSARLSYYKGKIFAHARYTAHRFSDMRVPAEQFEYNGFVLPIMDQNLRNTGGEENNISLEVGFLSSSGITRLRYSGFHFNGGLFSGAVGIPRSYTLRDDGDRRNIETPSQSVNHQMWTFNHQVQGKSFDWSVDAGYQDNQRSEFSRPEFHRIPLSGIRDGENLALGLLLRTLTVQSDITFKKKRDEYKLGTSFQWQQNRRKGFEFLLPDYRSQRWGLFGLWVRKWKDDLTWTSAVRWDFGRNHTTSFTQYIWNSNEVILDSLVSRSVNDFFSGFSANTGLEWEGENIVWKSHLSKSFRIPHPVETSSNGIHHGTFRHEQGQENLQPESGYQWDVSVRNKSEVFTWNTEIYLNYIDNFIYLGPTFPAQFSNLPEAGQIFRYRQDNAVFAGFECEWQYKAHRYGIISQSMDFVQSINTVTGLALPFTPQPSLKTELSGQWVPGKSIHTLSWNVRHRYYMAAESGFRRDRSERPTPATMLFDAGMTWQSEIGSSVFKLSFLADNIFNTAFLNHLSRYRWLNIPEQGRNLILMASIHWK